MKTILVLGASGGIGKKVVKVLLDKNYNVIGTYNRHFLKNIFTRDNFKALQLNLADVSSFRNLSDTLKDTSLYGIVNCAGIVQFEGASIEEDIKIWQETLAINLSSNFYLVKFFEKNFVSNGRFIMISSTDSYYGGEITASYAASKAGVNSLTKSFSLLLKQKKIRVNAIAPGWVSTPMIAGNSKEFYQKLAEINPLSKIADPEDIANIITFLLSDDADYINGQVITVDGGYTNQDPTLLIEEGEK